MQSYEYIILKPAAKRHKVGHFWDTV